MRRHRLDLGLTQRTLAQRLDVRPETVRLWERGGTKPLTRHYGAIVRFLGYDPEPGGESLPARLLAVRRRLGLSLAQLASRTRLDPGSISRWTRASRSPSPWMLNRLRAVVAQFEGQSVESAEASSFFDRTRWCRRLPLGAQPTILSERLRARRLERGMSQRAAGACLGVGRATMARWERDECLPAPGCVAAIVNFVAAEAHVIDPKGSKS